MKRRPTLLLVATLPWLLAGAAPGRAADEIVTAVFSSAYNGYARSRQSDGKFKPETYAFGDGGYTSGLARDDSIDRYPFRQLVGLLAPYLARESYVPTQSPGGTDLLIVVHWGTTIPFDDGQYRSAIDGLQSAMRAGQSFGARPDASSPRTSLQMRQNDDLTSYLMMVNLQDSLRDKANARNAALLGYLPDLRRIGDAQPFLGLTPQTTYYRDMVSDLEEDRYYVILAAYDFQRAWKQKQAKLLWITRVSIRAHGNRFDQDVETMIRTASRYFGEDTRYLIRGRVPEGKVEVGEPKVIGVTPDAGK